MVQYILKLVTLALFRPLLDKGGFFLFCFQRYFKLFLFENLNKSF